MSVEKVLDWNIEASIGADGSVLEDVLGLSVEELLAVLVAKGSDMISHAGRGKLLVERDLLELHVMDTSRS